MNFAHTKQTNYFRELFVSCSNTLKDRGLEVTAEDVRSVIDQLLSKVEEDGFDCNERDLGEVKEH